MKKQIWINKKVKKEFDLKLFQTIQLKIIPIQTQKNKDQGVMEKSLLDLTVNIRNEKK